METTTQQFALFELEVTALDFPTTRRRWNGQPMASEQASTTLLRAADAFTAVLREAGFEIERTGYGVRAMEI